MKKYLLIVLLMALSISFVYAQLRVSPVTEYVVQLGPSSFRVFYGYYNRNDYTVTIPLGNDNKFTPSPIDRGQPTEFLPGRHVSVFYIDWEGSTLTWTLKLAGTTGGTATASGSQAIPDTDGDGVLNPNDAYPTDPLRAYNVFTPSSTGYGTLAFEDMWPDQGDYDMNDLVIDYRFTHVHSPQNQIKDIKADLRLRAIGASRQNSFSIEFPFPISEVESHQGYLHGNPINMSLVAAGNRTVLKVISSTADYVNVPGGDVFWNTQMDQPAFDPIDFSFVITLYVPIEPSSLPYLAPYNPFINVNRQQGYEVHLPGMPPTVFADQSLFGTGADTTDPSTGRYYKTANNLPWAVNIPISWKYPIERKQITEAYLAFKPWAESGGTRYPNWFELEPAQINSINIYDK